MQPSVDLVPMPTILSDGRSCLVYRLLPWVSPGKYGFGSDRCLENFAKEIIESSYIWDFQSEVRFGYSAGEDDPYLQLKGPHLLSIWTPRVSFVQTSKDDVDQVIEDFQSEIWGKSDNSDFDVPTESLLSFFCEKANEFKILILWDMTDFTAIVVSFDRESLLDWLRKIAVRSDVFLCEAA
jgi:hypothetical protein